MAGLLATKAWRLSKSIFIPTLEHRLRAATLASGEMITSRGVRKHADMYKVISSTYGRCPGERASTGAGQYL